jgi:ubiquitin C-terminal hydrolase
MSSAFPFREKNKSDSQSTVTADDTNVKLTDCLKEFKQKETLDEENMWYCSKCKEHVQATKTLEIFKLPKVMIVSLKRFRS